MKSHRRVMSACSMTPFRFLLGVVLGCMFGLLTHFAIMFCPSDRSIPLGGGWQHDDSSVTPRSTTDENLVLIGIMSAKQYLESRVIPGFGTWATTVPGKVMVFSSEGSSLPGRPDIPIIALPDIDDSYPPQRKSFTMLQYMYGHFRDKFRFFMRADDDIYINGDVLRRFLHSVNSTNRALFIGQAGLGTKEEFGQLSLKREENFCMGGPGMILSRDTLIRVAPHVSHCLEHLLTSHEDVELGRCIHQFAGVTCTWSYEMQKIMYNNYREPKGSFTHSLKDTDIHLAATLHPVKNASFQYRLHKYFLMRKSLQLRNKLSELQRQINDAASEMMEPVLRSHYSLHPSLMKPPQAKSRHEVLRWDFLNSRTISSPGHKNPKHSLENHLKLGLTDIVRQVMSAINVNARQRGRVMEYRDILYGYRRLNPLHGADYMLDLLLTYRKFKGHRKMNVPVRRHAYLQQAFLEPEFHILSPSQDPLSQQVASVKPSLIAPRIDLILPLAGRYEAFRQFMDNFESICMDAGSAGEVALLIVLFIDEGSTGEVDLIKSRVSTSQLRYPHISISVVRVSGQFSRGAALQQAAELLPRHSLMFFIDVDVQFTVDVLRRVRLITALGNTAYYPVVFSQYDPSMASGTNFSHGAGSWRQFGYGIVAVFNSDFIDAGGFNLDIRGWGREDVDLVERLLARNVTVFRAADPGLVHLFHAKTCDPRLDAAQYQMCLGSKAASFASLETLSEYVRHMPEIYSRADASDDLDLPVTPSP